MKYNPEDVDKMGEFHNTLVKEIDSSSLSPSEICMILDMVSRNIKILFEGSVKKERT